VRVLIDYRPALRERSGAGEYTHQLVRALTMESAVNGSRRLDVSLFSSSWKDRLVDVGELGPVSIIDRRVPVRVLNLAWHRLEWPPVELLTGRRYDVTHSSHPLILPARRAAQVITIHDLNFLEHPERTRAEVRRDYPALARRHAHRADRILVSSNFTAREVVRQFGVPREQIALCPPGAPDWPVRATSPSDGYVLFVGTLEPRKNVGGLLDAYKLLLDGSQSAMASVPELVLAGRATDEARIWLDRIQHPPLAGVVRHVGYFDPSRRRELYGGARLLVLPSFEEGFGLPVLEAMTIGVPVVAARRGALPEVLGDAGLLVDPDRPDEIADAIARLLGDRTFAAECAARGVARARTFRWDVTARTVYDAYQQAIEHHAHRR
jgi:glycosyltransferase involved in cell wall biosynthesis